MVTDADAVVKRYLKETFRIRNVVEKIQARSPADGPATWILAPWSPDSISINCGLPKEEVLRALDSMPETEIVPRNVDGSSISVAVWSGNEPPSCLTGVPAPTPGRRVRDLINLHIYNYICARNHGENQPVKLEDALFDLKNSIMLPDDFIPDYLMANIEGEKPPAVDYIIEKLQPFSGRKDIYCYFEPGHHGPERLAYMFASSHVEESLPGNNEIERLLGESFRSLSSDPDYQHFELSRYIRSLLFNIKRYGSRELRRPLPPAHIIDIMNKIGILTENSGKYSIAESISTTGLEEVLEKEKNAAVSLAIRWLNSTVEKA